MIPLDYNFSDADIRHFLKGQVRVIKYADLQYFNSIHELLKPFGNCVILYPRTSDTNGHWTALFYTKDEHNNNVIEFFDPYGMAADVEFNYLDIQYPRYLARLLYKQRRIIHYNNKELQVTTDRINTCGAHCVTRIVYKHIPIEQYCKELLSTGNADVWVCRFCETLL